MHPNDSNHDKVNILFKILQLLWYFTERIFYGNSIREICECLLSSTELSFSLSSYQILFLLTIENKSFVWNQNDQKVLFPKRQKKSFLSSTTTTTKKRAHIGFIQCCWLMHKSTAEEHSANQYQIVTPCTWNHYNQCVLCVCTCWCFIYFTVLQRCLLSINKSGVKTIEDSHNGWSYTTKGSTLIMKST